MQKKHVILGYAIFAVVLAICLSVLAAHDFHTATSHYKGTSLVTVASARQLVLDNPGAITSDFKTDEYGNTYVSYDFDTSSTVVGSVSMAGTTQYFELKYHDAAGWTVIVSEVILFFWFVGFLTFNLKLLGIELKSAVKREIV